MGTKTQRWPRDTREARRLRQAGIAWVENMDSEPNDPRDTRGIALWVALAKAADAYAVSVRRQRVDRAMGSTP